MAADALRDLTKVRTPMPVFSSQVIPKYRTHKQTLKNIYCINQWAVLLFAITFKKGQFL